MLWQGKEGAEILPSPPPPPLHTPLLAGLQILVTEPNKTAPSQIASNLCRADLAKTVHQLEAPGVEHPGNHWISASWHESVQERLLKFTSKKEGGCSSGFSYSTFTSEYDKQACQC